MKQRVGIIFILTGMILLLKPGFEVNQILALMNESLSQYWPVLLVLAGIQLLNKKQNKHKKKSQ